MEKFDIKDLARVLKRDHDVSSTATKSTRKIEVKRKEKKPLPKQSDIRTSPLREVINAINTRDDFNSDGCVYIDSGLHEILRHIKLRNKLKVGCLVSWLIEQFIHEHQKEIAVLLRPAKNRFMDT